jgi:hypothetical protein
LSRQPLPVAMHARRHQVVQQIVVANDPGEHGVDRCRFRTSAA